MQHHFWICLVGLSLFATGCGKKRWTVPVETTVATSITQDSVIIAGKPLIFSEFELKSTGMHLEGVRLQADNVVLDHVQSMDFKFLEGVIESGPQWELLQGSYESLKFSMNLDNSGTDILEIEGDYYLAGGNTYHVQMQFPANGNIDKELITELTAMEKDNPRTLSIQMNPVKLFEDVNPGLWNAAAVQIVGGNSNIVVNQLNNASIYNAILANLSASIEVRID